MEFGDIKIGSKKPENPEKSEATPGHEKKHENVPPVYEDHVIDADVGSDLLERIKNKGQGDTEQVIYGVYNNSGASWTVRLNDFFVDHSKVKLKEKSYFFHMLAVMVDAGIPVVQAVKSLASRSQNQRFQRVLNTIAHDCEAGANLSDAMSRFEAVFDEAEVGIVKSGEATGKLYAMLFKLSDQLDKRYDLYLKLRAAAVYPIVILAVLVLVVTGMLVWIFPTLLNLLNESGVTRDSLPLTTRLLIGLQNAVVNFWWLFVLIILGIYGVFSMYVNSSYGAVNWDYRKLNFPIVGSLIRKLNVLRFVSLVGILVEAGLPVINVLKITGNSLTNRVYKLEVQEVIERVKGGRKISESLMDKNYLFPPEVVQMLAVGEASANLAKVSEKVADQYQREVDNSLSKLTSVFGPLMIIFVGGLVALMALAIMGPLFNLGNLVGA
mgnify:CR=1 FL=1